MQRTYGTAIYSSNVIQNLSLPGNSLYRNHSLSLWERVGVRVPGASAKPETTLAARSASLRRPHPAYGAMLTLSFTASTHIASLGNRTEAARTW